MGGIADGQDGRVAPEPRALQKRRPVLLETGDVVSQLEQAVAPLALEPVGQRVSGTALDAGETLGQGVAHDRFPNVVSTASRISSIR